MMCQSRFTPYNRCTTVVGDVDNGVGSASIKQRIYGKFLYCLFNFAVKLNLLKKSKHLKICFLKNPNPIDLHRLEVFL